MSTVSSRRPHRPVMAFAGAVTALLIAAGCSGSDGDTSSPGDTDPVQGGNPLAAYTECMRQNGVTLTMPSGGARTRPSGAPGGAPPSGLPRPSAGAGGPAGSPGGGAFRKPADVDDATWEKAQAACASVRPSFGGQPGRGNGADGADAAYRNCLRDNGVPAGDTLSSADPAVAEAMEKCGVLRPTAGATPTA